MTEKHFVETLKANKDIKVHSRVHLERMIRLVQSLVEEEYTEEKDKYKIKAMEITRDVLNDLYDTIENFSTEKLLKNGAEDIWEE